MLKQKTSKKKELISIGAILFIIIIILFLLYKDKIFGVLAPSEITTNVGDPGTIIYVPEKPKAADAGFFQSGILDGFKNNQAYEPSLEELTIGKDNPFIKE